MIATDAEGRNHSVIAVNGGRAAHGPSLCFLAPSSNRTTDFGIER